MFNHLTGKLSEINLSSAVIDCNGVGYSLFISMNTYSKKIGRAHV